ncbi:transporter substrate-binding domain-containing protein [Thalassotalea profundi]|uniref:Amino acid ABC transporter substrate-binding protein n=1 Tax=Thalassotalea profundi TaxID=2036687 RepID=A0ABQ3IEW3_9GAMM|nr:transporter substrate-binding domain-containing protein [Thalassotalea profundi]GHE81824.1 amino acid ABC transporter substrate-binding protein [Thalassotalea profundi]
MINKMIIKPMWLCGLLTLIALCMSSIAYGQNTTEVDATTILKEQSTSNNTLVIGVKEAPPFAKIEGESFSGLAIDLWKEIAEEQGWDYRFQEYDLDGLLSATSNAQLDVGLGAITATADRAKKMDFTHTITSSGLSVAVRNEWSSGWLAVLAALASPAFLKVIGMLTLLLLGVGFVAWLLERKANPEQFGGSRANGLFSGFWWAMVTMTTVGYGDVAPRTIGGRLLGMVWMLTALIIVSFFTASITSALTIGQLSSKLNNADDLVGMHIASVNGSTSASWLQNRKLKFENNDSLSEALQKLADGKVDVVVYDAPLLRWTIKQEYAGELQVLPITLARQDYVFALPDSSLIRESINESLLKRINSPDWPERVASYFDGDK